MDTEFNKEVIHSYSQPKLLARPKTATASIENKRQGLKHIRSSTQSTKNLLRLGQRRSDSSNFSKISGRITPFVIDKIKKELVKSKRLEKNGRLQEAFTCLAQFKEHIDHFPESWRICKQLIKLWNMLATKGGLTKKSVTHLRNADNLFKFWKTGPEEKLRKLKLITLNNWATYHQQSKNFHMAIHYLMQAQKFCDDFEETVDPQTLALLSKTKLNLSALYIELRRFEDAREFAEQSLAIIQGEVNSRLANQELDVMEEQERNEILELITTMVIAFYNVGAAAEALYEYQNAIEAYKNAANLGIRYLDQTLEIVQLAKTAYEDARIQADASSMSWASKSTEESRVSKFSNQGTDPKGKPIILRQKSRRPSEMSSEAGSIPSKDDLHGSDTRKMSTGPLLAPLIKKSANGEFDRFHEKYYTERELDLLTRKMELQDNFIDTEQYFNKKINKMLNVAKDIKYMKPYSKGQYKQDEDIKREFIKLQLRRHVQDVEIPERGTEFVKERLKILNEEMSEIRKHMEVNAQSQARIEVQRELQRAKTTRNLPVSPAKPYEPPQRLFFKAPYAVPGITDQVEIEDKPPRNQFEIAKEGIESLMEQIGTEMRVNEETTTDLKPDKSHRELRTMAMWAGKHTEDIRNHMQLAHSTRFRPKMVQFVRGSMRKFTSTTELSSIVDRKLRERKERNQQRQSTVAFSKMDAERRKSIAQLLF